ncbi:unnamed protein product, partial [Effrenium voratum]
MALKPWSFGPQARRFLATSVLDGHQVGFDLWRHLAKHAEFYCRNQDTWNLALDLGPPCDALTPMVATRRMRERSILSRVVRSEGDAASGGKLVIALPGNKQIETAIVVSRKRSATQPTICVSSQAGCAMACRFCDTGLRRGVDLPAWAILEQVLHAEAWLQRANLTASNVVFMGMGEPLLNYSNTLAALNLLCRSHKTTLST